MFDALKKVNTAVHILHFQCKLFDIILYMLVHVFNKQLSKPVLFLVKCVIFLQFASDKKGSWQGNTKNLVLLSTIVLGSIVHSSSVFCFVVPDKSEKKIAIFQWRNGNKLLQPNSTFLGYLRGHMHYNRWGTKR